MQSLPESALAVIGRGQELLLTKAGDEQTKTLLATVDMVIVDVYSWVYELSRSTTRKGLLDDLAIWIEQLWAKRPRCKTVVLVAERSREMPPWRRSLLLSKAPIPPTEAPLPYMWDDECLGGPQGFSAWIRTPNGIEECIRTLMADLLFKTPEIREKLAPRAGKPLIIDCDTPGKAAMRP